MRGDAPVSTGNVNLPEEVYGPKVIEKKFIVRYSDTNDNVQTLACLGHYLLAVFGDMRTPYGYCPFGRQVNE
jgi:hypothetical protein